MFPGGFTPQFGGDLKDYAAVAGLRGTVGERINWDASAGYGYNRVDFFINNTVNASLGPHTPTTFDPGSYIQDELNVNFDVAYELSDTVTLAAGAEYRDETFEIEAGQIESWDFGPLAAQGFSAASNGFPGIQRSDRGQLESQQPCLVRRRGWRVDRSLAGRPCRALGGFRGLRHDHERQGCDELSLQRCIRDPRQLEHGLPRADAGPVERVERDDAVRPAVGELVNQGTIPSTNPVALLRGGEALEPEESQNFSVGAVLELGNFTLTADYYIIEVDDRIAVSQDFELTPAEVAALVASGVTSAANLQTFRFFTNDFDTETKGIDLVATYDASLFGGRLDPEPGLQQQQDRSDALQSRHAECEPHPTAGGRAAGDALEPDRHAILGSVATAGARQPVRRLV